MAKTPYIPQVGDVCKTRKACQPAGAFYSYKRGSQVTVVSVSATHAKIETYGGGYWTFAHADLIFVSRREIEQCRRCERPLSHCDCVPSD